MSTPADASRVGELELTLERDTAVLLDRLERQAQELERLEIELGQAREDRDLAQRQAEKLEVEVRETALRLARVTQTAETLARLERVHSEVLASASWRITRPLRWAKQRSARR